MNLHVTASMTKRSMGGAPYCDDGRRISGPPLLRRSAALLLAVASLLVGLLVLAVPASAAGEPVSNSRVVAIVPTPSGGGYWQVAEDGGIFNFGDAGFFGSMGGQPLNAPIVGMAATPSGAGYWQVAEDGGIFNFGDAGFFGSMGGQPLNAPIVGIAPSASGAGYWEVAADGGIFNFGDAGFFGSMGGQPLNAPVVGIASTPSGAGYWEVAADGGIFNFGDAGFFGSMGGQPLNAPVVGIAATPSAGGYWEVAADGGIFNYGDAPYINRAVYSCPARPGVNDAQYANATTVVHVGTARSIPEQGVVVALATASQESSFQNYANDGEGNDLAPEQQDVELSLGYSHEAVGSDHGSLGIMQQQYPWWGSIPELMDAGIASSKFYDALLEVPGWEQLPVAEAAQAVQNSQYPDAYADDEEPARQLYAAITCA